MERKKSSCKRITKNRFFGGKSSKKPSKNDISSPKPPRNPFTGCYLPHPSKNKKPTVDRDFPRPPKQKRIIGKG